MDTNPLAADPQVIIDNHRDEFANGLRVLRRISDGPVYVCTRENYDVPGQDIPRVYVRTFEGPHPAGLVGTHIHFYDPVSAKRRKFRRSLRSSESGAGLLKHLKHTLQHVRPCSVLNIRSK